MNTQEVLERTRLLSLDMTWTAQKIKIAGWGGTDSKVIL
jgi:hypothetical protein